MPKRRTETTKKPAPVTADAWRNSRCSNTYCSTPNARVTLARDPYAWEIHGDATPVWLCAECRYDRSMDV